MTWSRLVWAAVLALLFFVNLLASAPARLLNLAVPAEQLVMHGLTGTVWSGSASSVLLRLPQGYLHLGAVQWTLRPLSLVMLAPQLTLHSAWGNQVLAGELVLRGQRDLDVLNLEGRVGADLLRQFAPLAVGGTINMQLEHLQLRGGLPYSAQGRVVWEDGGWNSPRGPVSLGTYALDFQQAAGEALRGQVVTLSGPLEADGRVELRDRHYEVDILLGGKGAKDEQLQQMLSLIAQPQDGSYRLSVQGDF